MTPSAIVLVGHGSRDPEGNREFLRLVDMVRARRPERLVEFAYLGKAGPSLAESICRCVAQGARDITLVPGMLLAGGHTRQDIPAALARGRERYPAIRFHQAQPLHLHPGIVQLCRLRIEEAEQAASPGSRERAALLVVARGSADREARADVNRLACLLRENLGFARAEACFLGMTSPLFADALEECLREDFYRLIVFPFFLFTGVLEKRLRQQAREQAELHPRTEVLCASYLNAHPLLGEAFLDRARRLALE